MKISVLSMMGKVLFILFIFFLGVSCKGESLKEPESKTETKKYPKFAGSYKSFNDLHDLHMGAAQAKGIKPMNERQDTLIYKDRLIKLPQELDIYKIDKLTHSMPFVVDDAAQLIVRIGLNFRDSLQRKKLPIYKPILTSLTRTQDDVRKLTKRNFNASENSTHCYGTTFDISWRRFEKVGPKGSNDLSPDRLKYILAQVLHDLRVRDKCYIMHERKQACFHITVR